MALSAICTAAAFSLMIHGLCTPAAGVSYYWIRFVLVVQGRIFRARRPPARATDRTDSRFTMSIERHEPPSSSSSEEACSSTSKDKPYYDQLSSLYHCLDPALVPQLEQAIVYGEVRAFREASELCEKLLSDFHHHPVIAIEHAQLLWRHWAL